MKKILLLLITLLLTACTTIETQPEPSIINPNHEDDSKYEIQQHSNKPISYTVDHSAGFAPLTNILNNGADYEYNADFKSHDFKIIDGKANIDSLVFSQNGIYLASNSEYEVSFKTTSSTNKNINVKMIDSSQNITLYDQSYTVLDDTITFRFKSSSELSYTGSLQIAIGGENISDYNINIQDIMIKPLSYRNSVKVNQLGYRLNETKIASFSTYAGDYFNIYDNATNELVYQGSIVDKANDQYASEIIGYGDFSDFDTRGEYYIVSQYGSVSYPFEINDEVYSDLMNDVFKMISSQRCGYDLLDSIYHELAHPACHKRLALAFGFSHEVDAWGGWHDAGDYGRYVSTTAKTTIDLMMAYLVNGDKFDDDMNILESGNNVNDLLDEIKVGTDFLLRMQMSDGSVYHKIVPEKFSNFVSPEDDDAIQYAMNADSASTAFAGALFAIGSKLYEDIDNTYSNTLKEAATRSFDFIQANDFIDSYNPNHFGSGIYHDGEDNTERYLLYVAMWYMTNDQSYYDLAKELKGSEIIGNYGVDFNNPALYGVFLYALMADDSKDRLDAATHIIDVANTNKETTLNSPYKTTHGRSYNWGSNRVIIDRTMIMLMAYSLNNDYTLFEASTYNLDYVLGRNPMNHSYITGYGDQYPKNIHHRFTMTNNAELKGALVGGPNADRNDPITSAFNSDTPIAKMYSDNENSYSTNEVAIYYNSPLVFVLSSLYKN